MLEGPGSRRSASSAPLSRSPEDKPDPAGLGPAAATAPAPVDENTHDLDLIRSSLARTPDERLAVLQDFVDTFWQPRHG